MEPNRGGLARLRTTPRRSTLSQPNNNSISPPQPSSSSAEPQWTAGEIDQLVELISGSRFCAAGLRRRHFEARRLGRGFAATQKERRGSPPQVEEHCCRSASGKALDAVQAVRTGRVKSARRCGTDPANVRARQRRRNRNFKSVIQPVAGLSIVALNREVSITPVKPPQPQHSSSRDSSEELQVLRCCNSVHTQTPPVPDEPSAKKARHSSSSHADTTALLQRLVYLEERRVALQQEQLTVDREKVKCVRDLLAVLGRNDRTVSVPNGDVVGAVVSSLS
ncbi:hypothetical protein MRX96_030344 [Rhipicephalus microplus]